MDIWNLDIPARMRLFAWKVNIARRVSNFNMTCSACGAVEESMHQALFECPLAVDI